MNRSRQKRRTNLAPVLRAMAGAAGLALPLGGLAAGRIQAIEQGYKLGRLQAEQLALERENQKLNLEVSTLRAPARLEKLAIGKLGFGPPGNGDLLVEGGGSGQADLPRGGALAARGRMALAGRR